MTKKDYFVVAAFIPQTHSNEQLLISSYFAQKHIQQRMILGKFPHTNYLIAISILPLNLELIYALIK